MLDHWDYPTDGKGDCKIYALWKRKLLMDIGFPRQALLMTIVRDLEGNGHTILTVKTDRGEIILDNMVGRDPRLGRHRLHLRQAAVAERPERLDLDRSRQRPPLLAGLGGGERRLD